MTGMTLLAAVVLTAALIGLGYSCTPQGPGLPRDCREVHQRGCTMSGVYTIDPRCPHIKPFKVWCDMDNGQWTVFQKRKNGLLKFDRSWLSYVAGFGDPSWEYWLGLERIHCLTAAVFRAELRVDLVDFEGNKKYAQYNFFSVNNNLTNYRINFGTYTGDAGDALDCGGGGYHNGIPFSTFNRDNDGDSTRNCAQEYWSGWWHYDCHCANPNGMYNKNTRWLGFADILKSIEMKLQARDRSNGHH